MTEWKITCSSLDTKKPKCQPIIWFALYKNLTTACLRDKTVWDHEGFCAHCRKLFKLLKQKHCSVHTHTTLRQKLQLLSARNAHDQAERKLEILRYVSESLLVTRDGRCPCVYTMKINSLQLNGRYHIDKTDKKTSRPPCQHYI